MFEHHCTTTAECTLIESVVRVVSIEGRAALFEPEQQGSCGGCASAALCNEKGIGSLASRLSTRRFVLPNDLSLSVGDRVVVGVKPRSLVLASLVAYAIPLFVSILCAGLCQWQLGSDAWTLVAAVLGFVPGFLLMKGLAALPVFRADGDSRILRRVSENENVSFGEISHA